VSNHPFSVTAFVSRAYSQHNTRLS